MYESLYQVCVDFEGIFYCDAKIWFSNGKKYLTTYDIGDK